MTEISGERVEGGGGYFVLYRGAYRELPVVEVPIEGLLYRADNGRLIVALQETGRRLGYPPGYFRAHQERAAVQEQLHELLLDMSRDVQGPIYQELQRQGQQTEPVLITADGVVVNGNRRLAAMRDLLNKDSKTYRGFAKVRAAVLPPEAGEQDIEYVEAALQLAPETKLAYTWTNRRLKLRRQRDELRLPLPQILESYRLESPDALDRELQELALAEDYLENYCREPGRYARVEDAESLFVGLRETLAVLPSEDRDTWRWAGFALIRFRAGLDVDLSAYFPFAPPKPAHAPEAALRRLAVEEGLPAESRAESSAGLPRAVQKDLTALLAAPADAQRLARELLLILDQLHLEHRERNAPKRLLKHLRQARQVLEALNPEQVTASQKARCHSELAAVQYHIRRVLGPDQPAPPLIGGYAERAHGLNPEKPSLKAGLGHALRAVLGPAMCRRIGKTAERSGGG